MTSEEGLMSYFMTLSGSMIKLDGLEPIELLPASTAQEYIQQRAAEISKLDGTPLFLIHDGHSGTSHDFLVDAVNAVRADKSLEGTLFQKLMDRLANGDHTVRIWYASNEPEAHLHVKECNTFEETMREFRKVAAQTHFVNIRGRLAA